MLASFTFNQVVPSEPGRVEDQVNKSRSITLSAPYFSSLSSLVLDSSALSGITSPVSLSLVAEIKHFNKNTDNSDSYLGRKNHNNIFQILNIKNFNLL